MARKPIINNVNTNENINELEMLRQQLAELSAKFNQITSSTALPVTTSVVMDSERIKVMSLCSNVLNLNTQNYGKGKNFRFGEFGEVKNIPYKDLSDILEVNRGFLESGYFVILNPKVVESEGLGEIYEKILDKAKIEKILAGNESDAVNFFKSTTDVQRETIVHLILDKMMKGENFDLNLLNRLSVVIGPDYSIYNRFKEMKEVNTVVEPKTEK